MLSAIIASHLAALLTAFVNWPRYALLIFSFGFVVFFHELGHFLAAKWVGVKVEQFAVGFGQACFSWRKGMGFSWGSSRKRYEELLKKEQEGLNPDDPRRLGETEYRINWIPLGGYVKMLGQDDLRPGAVADDPRAYNRQTIRARMMIVSAGVIMNVILAAVGFTMLFRFGFHAQAPVVGAVVPGSPAQAAGLRSGDKILYLDGHWIHDFTKLTLWTALLEENREVPVYIQRPAADPAQPPVEMTLYVRPQYPRQADGGRFLKTGIAPAAELRGPDDAQEFADMQAGEILPPQSTLLGPGEAITQIDGRNVDPKKDFWKLDDALQAGKPVPVTITDAAGHTRTALVQPEFQDFIFGADPLNFAGMRPRPSVVGLLADAPVKDQIQPGDAIAWLAIEGGDHQRLDAPTVDEIRTLATKAADGGNTLTGEIVRGSKTILLKGLRPTVRIGNGQHGLGIQLGPCDAQHPWVSQTLAGSSAAAAGIPNNCTIVSVGSMPVTTWFDVRRALQNAGAGPRPITVRTADGKLKTCTLALTADDLEAIQSMRYTDSIDAQPLIYLRQTSNLFTATVWGVSETRDFILQFYVTLQRMFQGRMSVKNLMGPLGMAQAGAKFAVRGLDWLLWFMSLISANLAVVNFLPIPIVDGGLFTFLIAEKIKGRPLSKRTQEVAQIVGLALIISVFLLVTYQDIARIITN